MQENLITFNFFKTPSLHEYEGDAYAKKKKVFSIEVFFNFFPFASSRT